MIHLCKSARLALPSPAHSDGGCHASPVHGLLRSGVSYPHHMLVCAQIGGAVGMATVGGLRGEVACGEHELASGVACASASGARATTAESPCPERSLHIYSTVGVDQRARGDAS